jgi:hypothetical protein
MALSYHFKGRPKKFSNYMQGSKSAILAIFQTGMGWPCTVSAALRIPHRISKKFFALGANEFLAILEGKIRATPFFKVQSGKIAVCTSFFIYSLLKTSLDRTVSGYLNYTLSYYNTQRPPKKAQ